MKRNTVIVVAVCAACALASVVEGQDESEDPETSATTAPLDSARLFEDLAGTWEGTCRTWFRPDELADESGITGEFTPVMGGRFLRHTYEGMIQGKPRAGEELIAFNSVSKQYEVTWIDDFHMNYAIMYSRGDGTAAGFVVEGTYDVGPDESPWGWKTEYELEGEDRLRITAYNVSPDGAEAKATETIYKRVPR